jgi:D-alanyl-D-alanine carboxypeptidase
MKKWLLIAVIVLCPNAFGIDQAALTTLLEDARDEMNMPGLRAAVRLADGHVVRAAVGFSDVEANVPLDNVIGMPGGSTGKTFAAALTVLLVEDGKLSLDDLVSKYLGDLPWFDRLPNAEEIRVHHILSHTAGIADYPESMRYQMASVWRSVRRGTIKFETDELIGYVLDKDAPFDVGEGFHYTDAGYLVLGKLIEAASGRSYYDLLQERILDPLALTDVRLADRSIIPGIATGYNHGAPNLKKDGRMKFDPSSEWTGGGLVTTPTMLVHFYAALAEGRVVRPESFKGMIESGWRNPDQPSHYGLGIFVDGNRNAFGHGGMWPSYRTDVTHFLTRGITVSVQTNTDRGFDTEGLMDRIAALVP